MKALLKSFDEYCSAHNHRATPPRRFMLEIVAGAKQPVTAYEALELLGKKLDNPKPPTAYRALEFLSTHGFIHRIESLNAYISCGAGHQHQGSQFMICDDCGKVTEAHLCSLPPSLQKQADEADFTLSHWNVELHGRCKACT